MTPDQEKKSDSWEGIYWRSHKYNVRAKIKSGTYLHSFCPFCNVEITRENILPLEVINPDGKAGIVELSPYLNVFERKTDLQLPEGKEVGDLRCPACHTSLKVKDRKCGKCDAPAAAFLVGISNSRVPFYICMKVGCPWHSLSSEDENEIILDDSDEW